MKSLIKRNRERKKRITDRAIWVYNNGEYEQEQIVAEKLMRLIYENPLGAATLPNLVKRKAISRLYGMYCRTRFSAIKIPKFVKENSIDMTGFEGPYRNFADFFSREKKDVFFPEVPDMLGSPCEGLISAYSDIHPENLIAAKGSVFSLAELFGDELLAKAYHGGSMLRIRLTPTNYHRMHFFDEGKITKTRFLDGDLFSVSPLALKRVARLYCRNKRAMIQFSSQNFGDTVIVEVGATFVGSIVHCFEDGDYVQRGQQCSYFLPGGSLVLIFFKKGALNADKVLLDQTANGYETRTSVGDFIGVNK